MVPTSVAITVGCLGRRVMLPAPLSAPSARGKWPVHVSGPARAAGNVLCAPGAAAAELGSVEVSGDSGGTASIGDTAVGASVGKSKGLGATASCGKAPSGIPTQNGKSIEIGFGGLSRSANPAASAAANRNGSSGSERSKESAVDQREINRDP